MRQRLLPLVVLPLALALASSRPADAQQVVPGFAVESYATVSGPVSLSFDRSGALFVGRDDLGKVRRIPPGGGTAADYGVSAIPDPDGVLVDDDGSITGIAGAVLVCGDATGSNDGDGQIVAVLPGLLPDSSIVTLHAPSGVLSNPNYMERGRDGVLISDATENAVFELLPPGQPVVLIQSPAAPAFIAVDTSDRIYVSQSDGVVRQYDADGSPLNGAFFSGVGMPAPIAAAPGGAFGTDLYVLAGVSGILFRVSPDGTPELFGAGFPRYVGEIEFGPDGALYVASLSGGEVLRVVPVPPLPSPPPPEGFLCYDAKTSADASFERRKVGLADAFETDEAKVVKPKAICSPADRTGAGLGDPETHLASYKIKGAGRHEKRATCLTNDLDPELLLETLGKGADRLLLPSALASGTPEPLGDTGVDPYKCYGARRADRGRVGWRELTLTDEFGPTARSLYVKSPKHLCLPVEMSLAADEESEAIRRPNDLLVCYEAKPAKGKGIASQKGLHVRNALGDDQLIDIVKGTGPVRVSRATGTVRGDLTETSDGEGTTRPGVWADLDGTPSWAGGGELGTGEWLLSSFTDAGSYPEGEVEEWRVFVEVDITQNETGKRPGVAMFSNGIPGIPEGLLLRPKADGKPRGLRLESKYYKPPAGTTLSSLAGAASQAFEARGDGSTEAFAFEIKAWGIEYKLVTAAGGSGAGPTERELCVPSRICP